MKTSNIFIMFILFCMASGIGYIFTYLDSPETNVVVVYLLAVQLITWLTNSLVYGLAASVLATFTYNYFFAVPYFTFSVDDPNYITTFITMTITALLTSSLTSHAKKNALESQQKELETKALYELTNHLTDAKDMHSIAGQAVAAISSSLSCKAACLCFDEQQIPESSFIQQINAQKQVRRKVEDADEIMHRMKDIRTDYSVTEEFYDWPIYGSEYLLGIIRIPADSAAALTLEQKRLLHAMIENTALAMDRFLSSMQKMQTREDILIERYRADLLRAISHDLRTPLSGIIGTSEMLMDILKEQKEAFSLSKDIKGDADWLHAMVENILNLTRLQDGRLALNIHPESLEEILESALHQIDKRNPGCNIEVHIPEEFLSIPADARLIEQVLINLLDNAIKFAGKNGEIVLSVYTSSDWAIFSVKDNGSGIAAKDLPHLFQSFYTVHAERSDGQQGIGLGLTICDTIVKAHGGTITAKNREDTSGAEFTFRLPLKGESHGKT